MSLHRTHPTFERFAARVPAANGSTAATLAGRLKSNGLPATLAGLLAFAQDRAKRVKRLPLGELNYNTLSTCYWPRINRAAWKQRGGWRNLSDGERLRRRLNADKAFRARFMRGLRAEARRLVRGQTVNPAVVDCDTITQLQEKRPAVAARLSEISKFTGKPIDLPPLPVALLNPGSHPETWRKLGAKLDLRGKDARIVPTAGACRLYTAPGQTTWRNGRPVDYTRAVRDNLVRAFAVLRSPQVVDLCVLTHKRRMVLPLTCKWEKGPEGRLRLAARDNFDTGFEPVATELLRVDPFELAARAEQMSRNALMQQRAKA